ncbi:MAG: hypothetical protein VXZ40_02180 [Nanoarchaeota archaeon]|nr:hypothetical protein [Nanoarchaeota archaeon]
MITIEDKIAILLNTTDSTLREWNLGEVEFNLDIATEEISNNINRDDVDLDRLEDLSDKLNALRQRYNQKKDALHSMIDLELSIKNQFTGEGSHQAYILFTHTKPQMLYQFSFQDNSFEEYQKINGYGIMSEQVAKQEFRQNPNIDALAIIRLNTSKNLGIENCLLTHIIDRYGTQ